MNVGMNIRKYRKDKNITITKLAELVGTQREYLSSIENGKKTPSFTMIDKIASVLGVQINDLIIVEPESISPELRRLVDNAKQLHPAVLDNLNTMLENLNKNYKLVKKTIADIDTTYVVNLNVKPNGLNEEEELEAQRLIHRLKELENKNI